MKYDNFVGVLDEIDVLGLFRYLLNLIIVSHDTKEEIMLNKKITLLCLFALGVGMFQATLSEAVCTSAPLITVQPESVAGTAGDDVTFTVTAELDPADSAETISFEWYKDSDTTPLADGLSVSGATITITSGTVFIVNRRRR